MGTAVSYFAAPLGNRNTCRSTTDSLLLRSYKARGVPRRDRMIALPPHRHGLVANCHMLHNRIPPQSPPPHEDALPGAEVTGSAAGVHGSVRRLRANTTLDTVLHNDVGRTTEGKPVSEGTRGWGSCRGKRQVCVCAQGAPASLQYDDGCADSDCVL